MKKIVLFWFGVLIACGWDIAVHAFPPAPHHLFIGMVRDEFGNPLHDSDANILFMTPNGSVIATPVRLDTTPGVNFRLEVPMDAGVSGEPYSPTAMERSMPFEIWIEVGGILYSPLEVVADFTRLGAPGQTTALDLTIGIDLDGDGLPDAWEEALLAALGEEGSAGSVDPDGDADGDGLSNRDEYYSGNYAFDKNDGMSLTITGVESGNPRIEWLAIRGRSYSVVASTDLQEWLPVVFNVSGREGEGVFSQFHAEEIQQVRAMVQLGKDQTGFGYFRLMMH